MKGLIYFLKGIFIGGSMLVPGVSGGTMAMALGLYHKLISAVAGIRKKFRESLSVLLPFALGGVVGVVLLSLPLEYLLEKYPLPVMYFFVGSIMGGVPLMFKKAYEFTDRKRFELRDLICILLGAALPIAVDLISLGGNAAPFFEIEGAFGALLCLPIGVLCAVSLILPGISTSYMLLVFGAYDRLLSALSFKDPVNDVLFLLPLAIGALFGILIFTKLIERQLVLRPRATYTVILGFIFGSVATVFPYELPTGAQWIACPLLFALAFILMFMLSKLEK